MTINKSIIFNKAPSGWPKVDETLTVREETIEIEQCKPDEVLLKVHYLSLDPYMRGRMREPGTKSYVPEFKLGEPIANSGICTILRVGSSVSINASQGDLVVVPSCPFSEYACIGSEAAKAISKIDNPFNLDVKHFLGALGMPGLTAYSSLIEIGEPRKGETIFVSAAAGAVGQIVGQLAKHYGLTVIGSVGSKEKVEFVTQTLGFDHVFNYKEESPADALKRLAPNGIDIYFENVGGETLEAALDAMNKFGRIVVCGMISQYNASPEERYGVKNLFHLVGKSIKMQGFLVANPNMGPKHRAQHQKEVQQWLHDGSFKAQVDVTDGLDQTCEAFIGLLAGKNFGKAVVKV